MKEYHRGIQTTTIKKNEKYPITIINRLDQKSISLPRITDDKRFAGYPGQTGVAKKIAVRVPRCKIYVEPFAGAAKVFQELQVKQFDKAVLNDRAKFVRYWLRKNFPIALVTNHDFVKCIKQWDSPDTFFNIDPPYFSTFYDQDFSCFDRDSVREYDKEIIELCQKIKAKFIITTRKENKIMLNSGFRNYRLKSIYVLSGHYPRFLVTTNLGMRK